MKLQELPTQYLRDILAATERIAGPDSPAVVAFRRELRRRAWERQNKPAAEDSDAAVSSEGRL